MRVWAQVDVDTRYGSMTVWAWVDVDHMDVDPVYGGMNVWEYESMDTGYVLGDRNAGV